MTTTIDMAMFTNHSELLARTAEEMQRQFRKWAPLNGHDHPMLDIDSPTLAELVNLETTAKADNDMRVADGTLDWYGILEEEFYEAFATDVTEDAVTELVQVAAVALSAAYSLLHGKAGRA